ncbi:MAG: hypothetical protein JSU66_15905 [Deltaproteobacteria bacterium]|nr:MAG: hypothetical protein JSU66_15905 [Deltaproteobacteria bacterium]
MTGCVTLGTNALEGAAKSHDPLRAEIGAPRCMVAPTFIAGPAAPGPRGDSLCAGHVRGPDGSQRNAFFRG